MGHLERPGLLRSFIGLPIGVVIALLALRAATADQMAISIGVAVCIMTAALLVGLAPARTATTEVIGGAAAALTSTAAGLPGPPLVIAYHDLDGPQLRSTASAFINVMGVVAVSSLAVVGEFGRHELRLLVLMLPAVAVGLFMSRWVRPWLDRDWFRPAVLVLSFLGGLALIVDRLL